MADGVSVSQTHISSSPLRHLLAYQKCGERIIYETSRAGVRLRSVDAEDTRISQCNSLEMETDYGRRAGGMQTSLDRRPHEWKLAMQLLVVKKANKTGEAFNCTFNLIFFFIFQEAHTVSVHTF